MAYMQLSPKFSKFLLLLAPEGSKSLIGNKLLKEQYNHQRCVQLDELFKATVISALNSHQS